jgi:predicted phage-related endonuclease
MLWGRSLEPIIRQHYANETGKDVRVMDRALIWSEEHPFMFASLDGLTIDNRVLEIKTARSGAEWGEPGTSDIPKHYLLQVQHYLLVTGLLLADIAVLIGGSDFRIYSVEADKDLQAMMVEAEQHFWQRVVNQNPPEPVSFQDAVAKFGRASEANPVFASSEVVEAVNHLHTIKERLELLKEEEEAAKTQILLAMGENDTLLNPNGDVLATWKEAKAAKRFDANALKAEHPELYERFSKMGEPSRRFLLKG